ncbi:MAG: DUF2442 domain-containing protein [Verrucomicrobiota bacterium]|nr:DUF2442 domain-containing protein [Verrucomicrobiota bacterium]
MADSFAKDVRLSGDTLSLDFADGRTVSVPLDWYPSLFHATEEERGNWRLLGQGMGIHWPNLDEDISVEVILLGKPSGESQASFQKWLSSRKSL